VSIFHFSATVFFPCERRISSRRATTASGLQWMFVSESFSPQSRTFCKKRPESPRRGGWSPTRRGGQMIEAICRAPKAMGGIRCRHSGQRISFVSAPRGKGVGIVIAIMMVFPPPGSVLSGPTILICASTHGHSGPTPCGACLEECQFLVRRPRPRKQPLAACCAQTNEPGSCGLWSIAVPPFGDGFGMIPSRRRQSAAVKEKPYQYLTNTQ